MNNEQTNDNQRRPYPWKGFLIFIGIYLLALAAHYPVTLNQAEVYFEIMGGSAAYTPSQFAFLALTQPLLLGIIAIYFGHRYAARIHLRSLITEAVEPSTLPDTDREKYTLKDSVPFIVLSAGLLAILNLGFDVVFQSGLPDFYQPSFSIPNRSQILSNLLYQGVAQEMLLRWGVMTAIIYVFSSRGRDLNQWVYTVGIVFTAMLYAFAQYSSVSAFTDFNFLVVLRILLLSGLDGILYGWLYYKFHFEAATLSHLLTNALIILGHVLVVNLF